VKSVHLFTVIIQDHYFVLIFLGMDVQVPVCFVLFVLVSFRKSREIIGHFAGGSLNVMC
jgi:hypothetical protein